MFDRSGSREAPGARSCLVGHAGGGGADARAPEPPVEEAAVSGGGTSADGEALADPGGAGGAVAVGEVSVS